MYFLEMCQWSLPIVQANPSRFKQTEFFVFDYIFAS